MNKAIRALQKVSEDKNAKIIQQNLLNFKEQSEGSSSFVSLFPKWV